VESDRILARAEELLNRVGDQSRIINRSRQRYMRWAKVRAMQVGLLGAAILLALPLWGLLVGPVGVAGIILAGMIGLIGAAAIILLPRPTTGASDLPTTRLSALPLSTEEWLAGQRKALPPPAQKLTDAIGLKLETLSDQLRTLDEREPAAAEIRRLIADELPELVTGYARVPTAMRKQGLNGISPDQQLISGLTVVDSELSRMSEQLATGDLNKLATQGRYLEIKYQGDI
jgi:hypothetical protein